MMTGASRQDPPAHLSDLDLERFRNQFRDTKSPHRPAGLALVAECERQRALLRETAQLSAEIAEALFVELGGILPSSEQQIDVLRRIGIEDPENIVREAARQTAPWDPHEAIRRYRELVAESISPGCRERMALRDADT